MFSIIWASRPCSKPKNKLWSKRYHRTATENRKRIMRKPISQRDIFFIFSAKFLLSKRQFVPHVLLLHLLSRLHTMNQKGLAQYGRVTQSLRTTSFRCRF